MAVKKIEQLVTTTVKVGASSVRVATLGDYASVTLESGSVEASVRTSNLVELSALRDAINEVLEATETSTTE